MHRGQSKWL